MSSMAELWISISQRSYREPCACCVGVCGWVVSLRISEA